jgi:hypothetical protein
MGDVISHDLVREISCAARVDRRTALKYLRGGRLYRSTRSAVEGALRGHGLDHLLRRSAHVEATAHQRARQ